jgi:peptidyl-prolyl cis-trans isomerase SurA
MYSKKARTGKISMQGTIVLLIFLLVFFLDVGWGEVVDRIVAIVNDEVITLTDVDIILEFGLFEDLGRARDEETRGRILDRLIDQKLVIQLASERILVVEEELETVLSDIVQKTDPDLAERALLRFGMA